MSGTQLLMWAMALGAFALCIRRGDASGRRALQDTGQGLIRVLPVIVVALPMAGFLAELIPDRLAQQWLGEESGLTGIVIASAAGGLVPGGPFVSFPLVLTFSKAGAGTAQMVALISGWAIYGVHRVITWEWPVLGLRFVALRVISGLALPVLAGIAAQFLLPLFPGALALH
jgi:uncharacterized membrane protein YraQ (UPF0718 family)